MQGTDDRSYRVGIWYDHQPKGRFDGREAKHREVGLYLSFDQMALKEYGDPTDTQGLGLFVRYGQADGAVNTIEPFWSAGVQYQGLFPAGDQDVLALGIAGGRISPAAGLTASRETAVEFYYSARLTAWLILTGSAQYILNPGCRSDVEDAVVAGLRLQMAC